MTTPAILTVLFDSYEISRDSSYEANINKYQVIYLDMTNLLEKVEPKKLIQFIKDNVENEILSAEPDIRKGSTFDIPQYWKTTPERSSSSV